jgi:hypothetical protein
MGPKFDSRVGKECERIMANGASAGIRKERNAMIELKERSGCDDRLYTWM